MKFGIEVRSIFYDKSGKLKIAGVRSQLFAGGLILKLLLAFTFASDYLTKLFCPFVNYFVESGFQNPYTFFIDQGQASAFPYPPLMLWILALPRIVFDPLLSNDYTAVTNLHIFVMRIPILVGDFAVFIVLLRWLKNHARQVLIYYWWSPVLIYINYIHGQLDVIPIAILFVSLYFLFKSQYWLAVTFLSLAVCTKTNMVLVAPFFLVYVLKCHEVPVMKTLTFAFVGVLAILLIQLPYFNSSYVEMVLQNKEQMKVYDFRFQFSPSLSVYLVPASIVILMAYFLFFRSLNRDIFVAFLGFAFSLLTLLIPPMPGWYYWFLPFFIYLYAKQSASENVLYHCLTAAYFAYFIVVPSSDMWNVFQISSPELAGLPNVNSLLTRNGLDSPTIVNIVFSVLQGSLFANCIYIFYKGVNSNLLHKLKYKPFLIGISGDSGAGKSTFSNSLEKIFQKKNTAIIRGDDLHKWERGDAKWKEYTHLNPKANNLHVDLLNSITLKFGRRIYRRHYDHTDGRFTVPQRVKSNKLIIFEGLHTFFLRSSRDLLDLKIFVKPNEDLRRLWKVNRDFKKRGYSKEQVLEQMELRKSDSSKYIQSQENFADMVISLSATENLNDVEADITHLNYTVSCKIRNDIPLEPLVLLLERHEQLTVKHEYDESEFQKIEVSGTIESEAIEMIALDVIPELDEFGLNDVEWNNGIDGVIQLLITYSIFSKVNIENLNL